MWRSFFRHSVSKAWILFVRVGKPGPCVTAVEKDADDKRLVQLELACEADGVASPVPSSGVNYLITDRSVAAYVIGAACQTIAADVLGMRGR